MQDEEPGPHLAENYELRFLREWLKKEEQMIVEITMILKKSEKQATSCCSLRQEQSYHWPHTPIEPSLRDAISQTSKLAGWLTQLNHVHLMISIASPSYICTDPLIFPSTHWIVCPWQLCGWQHYDVPVTEWIGWNPVLIWQHRDAKSVFVIICEWHDDHGCTGYLMSNIGMHPTVDKVYNWNVWSSLTTLQLTLFMLTLI